MNNTWDDIVYPTKKMVRAMREDKFCDVKMLADAKNNYLIVSALTKK